MVRWLLQEGWKKNVGMAEANVKRELVLSATLLKYYCENRRMRKVKESNKKCGFGLQRTCESKFVEWLKLHSRQDRYRYRLK